MKKIILTTLLLSTIISCKTHYSEKSYKGGYSEERIDQTTFQVSFLANAYTDYELIKKYFMYRCAEITLNHDYDYFIICNNRKGCFKNTQEEQCKIKDSIQINSKTYKLTTYLYGKVLIKLFKEENFNIYKESLFNAEEVKKFYEPIIVRGSNKMFKK